MKQSFTPQAIFTRFKTIIAMLLLLLPIMQHVTAQNGTGMLNRPKDYLIVYGGLYDKITKQYVPDAVVVLMDSGYNVLDSLQLKNNIYRIDNTNGRNKDQWVMPIKRAKKQTYHINIKHPNYETYSLTLSNLQPGKRELTRFVTNVFLQRKMKEKQLGEVTVKATQVRIYSKGDTLVYNADAFNLAEGSMLDELIKQLPGVELNSNGQITVNGRFIESLLLNGEDFFNGKRELMLENLPAYLVKNIEVYEKRSKFGDFAGRDTGEEKLVMDVKLKRDYNGQYIANAELGGGTHDTYLGRLFGLYFDDRFRASAFANANNVNLTRKPGSNNEWDYQADMEGRTEVQTTGVSLLWKKPTTGNHNLQVEANATYNHRDIDNQSNSTGEQYLTHGNIFTRQTSASRNNWASFSSNVRLEYKFKDKLNVRLSPFISTAMDHLNSNSYNATYSKNPDSLQNAALIDDITVNRTISDHRTTGKNLYGYIGYDLWLKTGKGNDNWRIYGLVEKSRNNYNLFQHYLLEYPSEPSATNDFRNKYTDRGPNTKVVSQTTMDYWYWLPQNIALVPFYRFTYTRNNTNEDLYRLDRIEDWNNRFHTLGTLPSEQELDLPNVLDTENSTHSTKTEKFQHTGLYVRGSNMRIGWDFWGRLPINIYRDDLHYRRSSIDTLASQTNVYFEPELFLRYRWNNMQYGLQLYMRHQYFGPDVHQKINYTNNENPLYTYENNPHLKSAWADKVNFDAYRNNNAKATYFNASLHYSRENNTIMTGSRYDRTTGHTITRSENVDGVYSLTSHVNYTFPIDSAKIWMVSSGVFCNYNHNKNLSTDGNDTPLIPYTVQNVNYGGSASLQVNRKEYGLMLKVAPSSNYINSATPQFNKQNSFTVRYSASGYVLLPFKIRFAADAQCIQRKGYVLEEMNTTDWVVNASLIRTWTKPNITLRLDGYDLFHQLSNITQYVTNYGRSETWRNGLPSYAMLHVIYKLHHNPKKKQANSN